MNKGEIFSIGSDLKLTLGALGEHHFSRRTVFLKIADERGEQKFWDLGAQIVQIKHKFLTQSADPKLTLKGNNFSSSPNTFLKIVGEREEHKFWDADAQIAQIFDSKWECRIQFGAGKTELSQLI